MKVLHSLVAVDGASGISSAQDQLCALWYDVKFPTGGYLLGTIGRQSHGWRPPKWKPTSAF